MSVFDEYMKSEFAQEELKKVAEDFGLENKYPKAPARYGAVFKVEKTADGARLSFYLRAGIVVKTKAGEEVSGKENVFKVLRQRYPEKSDEEIHKIIQRIMMDPATKAYMEKMGRYPLLAAQVIVKLPQLATMSAEETREFLLTLLHNGVFDPVLKLSDKKPADFADLQVRLQAVEEGNLKEYPIKDKRKEEEKVLEPLSLDEFTASSHEMIVTAEVATWWYINEDAMTIEGPFASLHAVVDDQEQKINIEEEELAMAASENLEKLVAIADSLDSKGEIELAGKLDDLIKKACYDVTPAYDAVKQFHPQGGATTELTNKVKEDGAKFETITEQQKKDLDVANSTPKGVVGCQKCGLTHIAATRCTCPNCESPLK